MPAFYDELIRRGYKDLSESPAEVEEKHSLSGHQLKSEQTRSDEKDLQKGISFYLEGKFRKAKDLLETALVNKMRKPAIVARNQMLRDSTYQALVYLALVSSRLKDFKSVKRYVEEFMRSLPDREVSSRQFGPEASSLFLKHSADYKKREKGKLQITLDDPSTVVFINERYVGVGEQNVTLYPGNYRVYTQRGSLAGRVYRVNIESNKKTRLHSDSVKDKAIVTEGAFYLSFDSSEDQEKYALNVALEIAESLDADELVLVSSHRQRVFGVHAVVGNKSVLGKVKVETENGNLSPKRQREFATKTLSGTGQKWQESKKQEELPNEGDEVIQEETQFTDLNQSDYVSSSSGISKWWRISAWTIGFAGVVSGAVLLKLHCDLTNDGADRFNTIAGGAALLGGGVAFVVSGFVLRAFESKKRNVAFDYDQKNNKFGFVFSGQF